MCNADKISDAYLKIMSSSIFHRRGPDIDLCEALVELCTIIDDVDAETWASYGDCMVCSLGDLLVGAYWALSEWHGGASSDEYAALCAVGGIYSPGYADGPEAGTGEEIAYDALETTLQYKLDPNVFRR